MHVSLGAGDYERGAGYAAQDAVDRNRVRVRVKGVARSEEEVSRRLSVKYKGQQQDDGAGVHSREDPVPCPQKDCGGRTVYSIRFVEVSCRGASRYGPSQAGLPVFALPGVVSLSVLMVKPRGPLSGVL